MEHRWIEKLDEFQESAGEWDRVLLESGEENPFLLSDFILTSWRYYHRRDAIRVLVISDKGRIVGGLPLYLREERSRALAYIGGSAANYTEPLWIDRDPARLTILVKGLMSRKDWDVLQLTDVREETRLLPANGSDWNGHCRTIVTQDHANWAINLGSGKEAYLQSVSKKLRRDLRSRRKNLVRELGPLTLLPIHGRESVEHYFHLYRQFSVDAFAARNRTSSFSNEAYADFFREFLAVMDSKGRLDAHVLLGGGEIVLAISFGYRFGRGFNWVLTGFNYHYREFRPGYLLIEELIDELSRRGETYYNWYGNARFYKTQWCNEQKPLLRLFVFNETFAGNCSYVSKHVELAVRRCRPIAALARRAKRLITSEQLH